MSLQESGEMYLEAIYILTKKHGNVRSVDVSEYMGFKKPSVSRAVGLLKEGGYICVESTGNLALTEEGRFIAEKIYERHILITDFLVKLGVNKDVAAEDACKLEHVLSDESFKAIKSYAEKFNR